MENFNPNDTSEKNVELALMLHKKYANVIDGINLTSKTIGVENKYKTDVIKQQQVIQSYLMEYFESKKNAGKTSRINALDVLKNRHFNMNLRSEDGEHIKEEMVHIGLDFIHEHFNENRLFPLATFFSLIANSGVGKSDYIYRMANKFLMQDYKTLICSYEFGEDRMGRLIDDFKNGGKDRFKDARESGKLSNLEFNFKARDLESLELLIDTANEDGIKCILIDSFGEIERNEQEYILQQKISMMLNAKSNDYKMFIGLIGQTKSGEIDGEYTIRGGTDLIYKPDLSIHIKKVNAEDTSGDRVVHLFKNRESDLNGKTIITQYDFEKREPTFKCDYDPKDKAGEMERQNKAMQAFRKKK